MAPPIITKEQFLTNLEKALNTLILKHIYGESDDRTKMSLRTDIREFIDQNASKYSLEELTETFINAEVTIGLFLEYQDAKRLIENEIVPPTLPQTETFPCNPMNRCQAYDGEPVFPSDFWQEPQSGIDMAWVHG